jgi:hypothetical protein
LCKIMNISYNDISTLRFVFLTLAHDLCKKTDKS